MVVRATIAAVVVAGVTHRVYRERAKLAAYQWTPRPGWLVAGGAAYAGGLTACAAFWWMAMCDRGGRPTWPSTLAAYFAGHLGKYVPGKGLVLVIRAGMVRGPGVTAAGAAISAAHETLLMMAVGSAVAASLLAFVDVPRRGQLLGAAIVVAATLGVASSPPVVHRLGRLASRPFARVAEIDNHSCRWRTIGIGAAPIAVGWLLMGASLAAVLAATGDMELLVAARGTPAAFGLLTIVVALATVGGFVSLMPGGLGSREWILVETLGPVVGGDHALVAAVLLRLVWIAAECVAAGLSAIISRQLAISES
jgi:uncharacterized membrane protein YbhN (UPF0104 family)